MKAWRWWDGYGWTDHASDPVDPSVAGGAGRAGVAGYAVGTTAAAYPTAGAYPGSQAGWTSVPSMTSDPSVHDRFAAETKKAPWARRVVVCYVAFTVLGFLGAWKQSPQIHQAFHDLRVQLDNGGRQYQFHSHASLNAFTLISLPFEAAFYIVVLMWQFQAAKTARLLNLAATHSAGLGVGSWFIPVVNLWFPYQALRDCLPPDHSGRRTVARLWTFFIIALGLNAVAVALTFLGSRTAFGFAAVALASALGFVFYLARAIQLIADAHRQLLYPDSQSPVGDQAAVRA